MLFTRRHVALLVLGLSVSVARAGELPKSFTLGQYVPPDVFLYLHGVNNPERAWIEKEWAEVWEAFQSSGVLDDVIGLITSQADAHGHGDAEAHIARIKELAAGVDWESLFGGEVAFAERLSLPLPEYMLITRGRGDSTASNFKGLLAVLNHIASLTGKLSVASEKVHGVEVWSLGLSKPQKTEQEEGPGSDFPHALELFKKGEIIVLTTGRRATDEVLIRMNGTGAKESILNSARFKEALAGVKSPEDFLLFFNAVNLMEDLRGMMNSAFKKASEDEDAAKWSKTVTKALNLMDVLEYSIVTMETDGRRELTYELAKIRPDKMNSAVVRLCCERRPFERFDKYIPKDAVGFSLNGFLDLGLLYSTAVTFVEQDIPNGAEHIARLNGVFEEIGFDPQRDLFSWWGGEMISVQMPAAMVTSMGGSDSVVMFRVTDSELARQKINSAVDWGNAKLTQVANQSLLIRDADVSAEGFREVTHPLLAFVLRPVIGVTDGWLMIGTSASAVNKCLAVAAGDAPSILENDRFQEEGLIPKGPVMSASFADTSNLGSDLASVVGGAAMMFQMMAMTQPPEAAERPEMKMIKKLLGIGMKLVPVLQKIDFYSSEASVSVREGNIVRTQKVITYKKPHPATKTADVGGR